MSELPSYLNEGQETSGITLKGNSFDVKVGYNKRAAAKRDLVVILQDVEGTPLTDESGGDLVTEVEGFVTSELTTDKALSVALPTETRTITRFYTVLFADQFEVKKTNPTATPPVNDPYVRIINPEGAYKFITVNSRIEIATGGVISEDDPDNPGSTRVDGNLFETFIVQQVIEKKPEVSESGKLEVWYVLNSDPKNENPITYLRRLIQKERTGIVKIEEQFASTSEVSTSLLGIDRAETQLGLFSNVSTYGFNSDDFVFYTDNPNTGPSVWSNRYTEQGYQHEAATIEEVKNEGALKITTFPVPYYFPYPPVTQNIGPDGRDTLGLYNRDAWFKWQNFLQLGKTLYEYYRARRDLQIPSADPNSNYVKYNDFLSRFLPAINEWDDLSYYNGQNYNNNARRYYTQISIWTDTWKLIKQSTLRDPVGGEPLNFAFLSLLQLTLRGTGTSEVLGHGSVDQVAGVVPGETDLNPFKETWVNRPWSSANASGEPNQDDFQPGYGAVGGQFALLQSRQAFRYQPGRISGYTFGTRAFMDKTEGENYAEWGIYNDFDEYVFRREGANFYIVRRSTIHYPSGPGSLLQELGLADDAGNENPSFVSYYDKEVAGKLYTFQEIKISKERFNGDSLNGNGPSGYLLNTDEITMYKIEFGWYGAIGLRMYAYIPVESGEARWVVVHTFVIENKLNVPSMGDPFFRFKYEVRIGSGQAPDLLEPQVLYKYGTSMYIDGGDEGTVSVFSETSDEKSLPSSGAYTSIFALYPKTNIVSGGGVAIPNKKIIIPKQMSITGDGFAEISVVKCTACQGSSYLYMPNVTAGTFGDVRKFDKLPLTGPSSTVTLSPIQVVLSVLQSNTTILATTDANVQYLRPGDYLLDTDINGNINPGVVSTRIESISDLGGGLYNIYVEDEQSPSTTTPLVFQPTFIVDDQTRREYGLEYDDFKSKVIATSIWNTYLGNETTGTYNETCNLLMYVFTNDHELITDRELNPEKILSNQTTFTPANFFGESGTFDVRLSQFKSIVASSNPISGPNSKIKFLNASQYESSGQLAEWRMGFTPNKPLYNITGEITGWERPDGSIITENRGGGVENVVLLPESEYVYMDYHPFSQEVSYIGFETGESFRGRYHPYRDDFRIPNPRGSNSGLCSTINLAKNDPVEVSVTQTTSTLLQGVPLNDWNEFNSQIDLDTYLTSSSYFLTATVPIITSASDPTGGQIAVKIGGSYIKFFYDSNSVSSQARFANLQASFTQVVNGQIQVTYVVPVNIDIAGSYESDGVTPLITTPEFLIAYNSVRLTARYISNPGPGSDGIFEFDAFPLYAFITMRDKARVNGAEIHDLDLLGNLSTFNPQWKYNFIDGNESVTYNAGTNNQTGELNVNGVGSITQTPQGIDSLIPSAFSQVNRLSSSQIDRQGESLLRPGNTLTTLYINDETKTFDLTDVFGFDRKVVTPDILNTEAVYFVGRSLDGTNVNLTMNVTYVEQL